MRRFWRRRRELKGNIIFPLTGFYLLFLTAALITSPTTAYFTDTATVEGSLTASDQFAENNVKNTDEQNEEDEQEAGQLDTDLNGEAKPQQDEKQQNDKQEQNEQDQRSKEEAEKENSSQDTDADSDAEASQEEQDKDTQIEKGKNAHKQERGQTSHDEQETETSQSSGIKGQGEKIDDSTNE
ncbi:SipW-dependent-type signal peptide-containing protein [Lentibacillus salicampi]|uniref:Uncharacterized protein n=1 Tax=Lentibacillus salicampi TaxID=175306 RepID=A0A4Y9AGD5_9BACI|nr:SipW-dependent-type signal peptide-containing protein [Lentibacillus salicampi]TFJ94432.1 hypothetical protein E4U82_00505 [Lentibacillus salicampi]